MEFVEVVESKEKGRKSAEKKILSNLDEAIDFVNKYKKSHFKAKSLDQLINEL